MLHLVSRESDRVESHDVAFQCYIHVISSVFCAPSTLYSELQTTIVNIQPLYSMFFCASKSSTYLESDEGDRNVPT
jgi:hypothetical protein